MSSIKGAFVLLLMLLPVLCASFLCHNNRAINQIGALQNTADDNDETSFSKSLTQRIAEVQESESLFVSGLQKRVNKIVEADKLDTIMSSRDAKNNIIVDLPVVTLDALLPNQRLTGSTTDPTFCNLLRTLGLGGSFVMTSVNNKQRKIRRFGVVAKIELVDVDANSDSKSSFCPTSVTFCIVGSKRRCEILGPKEKMKCRIGRWRRSYDPDGEESRLGFGLETFVDSAREVQNFDNTLISTSESSDTQWTNSRVRIIDDEEEDANVSAEVVAKATQIIPLIEQWLTLASDQTTYDNIDVVARTRRKTGQPGLTVNAAALLKRVQRELGPRPPPDRPTSLALYGSALLNPLPALGVATELRGAVLEAEGAEAKLSILERGLIKSINNLDGTRPLNM
ncbi:hypothetical protein ACHAXM_012200 [Skeletonema potamos]|jgi:hypothetical protein